MRIGSGPITSSQVLDEAPEIAKLLRLSGIDDVVVYYGWGSRLEINQLWTPIHVKVEDLPGFVRDSVEQGIFSPGNSDLIIEDKDGTLTFLFCHESDIHLMTKNQELIDETKRHWREKGYHAGNSVAETG
jgi:hypothetical protein